MTQSTNPGAREGAAGERWKDSEEDKMAPVKTQKLRPICVVMVQMLDCFPPRLRDCIRGRKA